MDIQDDKIFKNPINTMNGLIIKLDYSLVNIIGVTIFNRIFDGNHNSTDCTVPILDKYLTA